ncbi:bile acid:Na+ symporter, BASS family [Fistulifera solaris]|uniref:Bile acid:Na+ symporter, BASS family n=1 Tax=Fistulifera solaris TaxID=1519565 RepID=A0A1Z5K0K2_FISSO|nr:bile acid:Na+ symporter, BASS family [Fistulifera solaris]|eukprot:GAX19626.1 bile acid:Na+ symporter, BASS family [Fistulifera solaris]
MRFNNFLVAALLPSFGNAFAPSARTSMHVSPSKIATVRPSSLSASYPRHYTTLAMSAEASETPETSETPAESVEKKAESFGSKAFDLYLKTADVATNLFPFWTVLFTAIALKSPQSFAWFSTEYFTACLAALMLSMGITLTPKDFADVAANPVPTILQFALCYGMMPGLALVLGKAFGMSPAIMAGMVLVGSVNGGQASNLCTYIAKGNVALSVLMTTATTLGAIFMTPILCKALLGAVVPIDALGIARSTIEVVLVPIVVGMTTNKFFPNFVKAILPFAPVVGVVSTCLLVGSSVAQVAPSILAAGWGLQVALSLLHLIGGIVGYYIPKWTGFGETSCRTMAIETSMKSSAFGFLLAKLHFGEFAARVPSAVSVVWMALTGSILAVFWRSRPVPADDKDEFSLKKIFSFGK